MDFNLNEYPTGGFFGGGYDGSVLADGLDTGKNQATGSPLGIYTKFESNGSTSDFQQSRLLRLNRFLPARNICKTTPQKKGLIFVYVVAFQKMLALRCYLIQFEKKRIMAI